MAVITLTLAAATAAAAVPAVLIYQAIHNLYFDELAKIAGPRLWCAFRLPFVASLWRGRLVYDVFDMHVKYGPVVRVAPNEVSFSSREAWDDIYCHRPGHQPFLKNPVWWEEIPGRAESIISASTWDNHRRHRKMMSRLFTEQSLRDVEPLFQLYTKKLIRRLTSVVAESGSDRVQTNMLQWFMFTTFDIIGDLCFGESFDCLDNGRYHPWIAEIFSYFKFGSLFATLRFYKSLADFVFRCLPASTVAAQERNYQWAVQKVHKRMNLDMQRPDFMTTILPYMNSGNTEGDGLSMAELENDFHVLILAGSETCGTALSGTTSYMIRYPDTVTKLYDELRVRFKSAADMTFESLAPLPYLNAVISEGLRMAPPVGGALSHVVPKGGDTVCGIWLPGGTHVGVHQWSANRSPEKFHNPNDFCPERWMPEALTNEKSPFYHDDRDAVQAFSVGHWACLGKNFALAELRLIMAQLVWHFDMKEADLKMDWAKQKQYVLMQAEAVHVELIKRA